MAYKKPYQPYNFDQSDRKTLNIDNFGGVDLSSQKFNVSSSRAIQSKNFVYRDGMIQKRYGYEQIAQVKPIQFVNENGKKITNGVNFNGIWKFIAEDGEEHVVAHIGSALFELKDYDKEVASFSLLYYKEQNTEEQNTLKDKVTYELLDQKSSAFVSGNKLWVLGGISYLCVRFNGGTTIYKVEEMDECFVPTTTAYITETYSSVNERMSYQAVNLLTKWRKNACITGTVRNKDMDYAPKYFEYLLDAPIVYEKESDMKDFSIIIETLGE